MVRAPKPKTKNLKDKVKSDNAMTEIVPGKPWIEDSELLLALFNAVPDAIFLQNQDGTILDCNVVAEQMTGFRKEELVGKDFSRIRRMGLAQLEDMIRQSISFSGDTEKEVREMITPNEMPFITKKGEQKIFQTSSSTVKIHGKECMVTIARDVTEQSKKLSTLIQSEKLYRRMIEILPDAMITASLKGYVTWCNATFCKMTGYAKEDIMGKPFNKIPTIRSIDMPSLLKKWSGILTGSMNLSDIDFVWKNKSGETRWGTAHVGVLDIDGEIALLVTLRDTTKKMAAEEAQEEKDRKMQSVIDSIQDAVFVHDINGDIFEVYGQASKLTGYDNERLIGLNISKLETPQTTKDRKKLSKDLAKSPVLFNGEYVTKSGKRIPVSISSKIVSTSVSGRVQTVLRPLV
jgi:PAS domain S-box-containing protein